MIIIYRNLYWIVFLAYSSSGFLQWYHSYIPILGKSKSFYDLPHASFKIRVLDYCNLQWSFSIYSSLLASLTSFNDYYALMLEFSLKYYLGQLFSNKLLPWLFLLLSPFQLLEIGFVFCRLRTQLPILKHFSISLHPHWLFCILKKWLFK